jgi:O-antigen/teichoic acid export membrane protein
MDKTNRIIYNTGVVYAQMIISMVISLLSIRFVLQALGDENYGIYTLVAGAVALMDVLAEHGLGAVRDPERKFSLPRTQWRDSMGLIETGT